jgi:outer membrane protein assembly factor BamB
MKTKTSVRVSILSLSIVCFSVASLLAWTEEKDWPQFRGNGANGQSNATNIPLEWSDEKNIVWKTEMPGRGASSPVTFGNRIYVTCYSGVDQNRGRNVSDLKRHLVCLDRESGDLIWSRDQESTHDQEAYQSFTLLHGYASGTPAIDDSGIYVFYGTTGAAAYDFDGNQRWLVNCGTKHHAFGTSNSPVIYQDLVIINAGVESGDLIALDKASGREIWRAGGMIDSWNTPTLVTTTDGKTELVVHIKGKILAFDPATGAELWNCEGIGDYICPSILAEGDVVFAIGGRQNMALAVRAGGRGDVSDSHVLWRIRKGSNVVSPVYHDGYLYWAKEERGLFYCVNAEDGTVVYEERVPGLRGRLYASPIAVDGKIIYVSREDGTFIVPAKPEYELLAHNQIKDDTSIFNGSPVVSNGQLLLRSDKYVYCIGQ